MRTKRDETKNFSPEVKKNTLSSEISFLLNFDTDYNKTFSLWLIFTFSQNIISSISADFSDACAIFWIKTPSSSWRSWLAETPSQVPCLKLEWFLKILVRDFVQRKQSRELYALINIHMQLHDRRMHVVCSIQFRFRQASRKSKEQYSNYSLVFFQADKFVDN